MAATAESDAQLKFRVSQSLRNRLEEAARTRGVSLNAEITDRLERSLYDERVYSMMFQGAGLFGIVKAIAVAMREAGQMSGIHLHRTLEGSQNWPNDPTAYDQAMQAATGVLEAFRPDGPVSPMSLTIPLGDKSIDFLADLGKRVAGSVLAEISDDEPRTTIAMERAPLLRHDLGPDLVERVRRFVAKLRGSPEHVEAHPGSRPTQSSGRRK
jgi:hypothetical protein